MEKLVRDKIPRIMRRDGEEPVTRMVSGEEYTDFLEKKLEEEVEEFLEKPGVEELGDVLEVVNAFCDDLGIDFRELDDARKKKKALKGGFKNGVVLEIE